MEGVINRMEDGSWRLDAINNGGEVIRIEKDCLVDVSSMNDGGWQNDDGFHYGVPTFETEFGAA